jgi:hypothetical protein
MRKSTIRKTILIVSGLVATTIGMLIVAQPMAFYAENGIDLSGQTSLLNETRASAGFLLASGLLILSGAFVSKLTFTSLVVSVVLYLAYGLARVLSLVVDGGPAQGLVLAMVLELGIGLVALWVLIKYPPISVASDRSATSSGPVRRPRPHAP